MRIGVVAKHELYFLPIKRLVAENNLDLDVKYVNTLKDLGLGVNNFDIIFFPHYSMLIPEDIFSNFNCVGFHIGNLPEDRGGSPIQNKILLGEYQTFVNAFKIDSRLDGGPIYDKQPVNLSEGNIIELLENVAEKIAVIILRIITTEIVPLEQPNNQTRFIRLSKDDVKIDLEANSLREIYDRIRMVDGLDYPRAQLISYGKIVELYDAKLNSGELIFKCKVTNVPRD